MATHNSSTAQVLGVIGGGQLARMMIPPAVALGVNIHVLAEQPGMSAAIATTQVGDYRDVDTVLTFAEGVDVITFDHEHVPQSVLHELVQRGVPVRPGPAALAVAQDKLVMRERLSALGLPVPEWAPVRNTRELAGFLSDHGGVGVVKTARGGYDGKGVRVVRHASEADDWFAALAEDGNGGALLAEELVDFARELAQSVARRPSGEIAAWPVVQTEQRNGVCAEVIAPAPHASEAVRRVAHEIANTVAVALDVTGVLAVELFETTDERVLINELAMRPHNTGHCSIDGSRTSQFEQHVRAVLDLPLGDTEPTAEWSVMVNILGGPAEGAVVDRYPQAMAAHPSVKFHAYGKAPRPGRKVGHVTACGPDLEQAVVEARAAAATFEG